MAMLAAVDEGYLLAAPAAKITVPDIEPRFLDGVELIQFEEAFDEWWALTVPFLADVGLRIGELSALRVQDVDLLRGSVRVSKTASVTKTGARIEKSPKSRAGNRTVPTLTEETADRIAEMIGNRGLGPDDYLFGAPNGGPMLPSNFRRRVFNPAVEKAGLAAPHPTPHALRHTAVAHWIASGATEEVVKIALWLGHRQLSTVHRFYGHLIESDASETRRRLSDMRAQARADAEAAKKKVVGIGRSSR